MVVKMNIYELLKLHKCATENRQELEKTDKCGCFYCKNIYNPQEIKEWCDNQQTAICPYCGVDSVIVNPAQEDLEILNKYYFPDIPIITKE